MDISVVCSNIGKYDKCFSSALLLLNKNSTFYTAIWTPISNIININSQIDNIKVITHRKGKKNDLGVYDEYKSNKKRFIEL